MGSAPTAFAGMLAPVTSAIRSVDQLVDAVERGTPVKCLAPALVEARN